MGTGWGGRRDRRPLPPAPRVILGRRRHLRLASLTTCSYKSTETQRAAHLNAGMNRYPDFYRISRFDIRINEKFDINITTVHCPKGFWIHLLMHIYLKNNPAEFYLHPVWNDWALGFFLKVTLTRTTRITVRWVSIYMPDIKVISSPFHWYVFVVC